MALFLFWIMGCGWVWIEVSWTAVRQILAFLCQKQELQCFSYPESSLSSVSLLPWYWDSSPNITSNNYYNKQTHNTEKNSHLLIQVSLFEREKS